MNSGVKKKLKSEINATIIGLRVILCFSLADEVINQTGKQVAFWQVKESVQDINSRFIKLNEFVGIQCVNFRPGKEINKRHWNQIYDPSKQEVLLYLRFQELESSGANQYVTVGIDF